MTEDETYLIEELPDEHHVLEIYAYVFDGKRSVTIHSNFRPLASNSSGVLGFSESMARQLSNGLLAVLSGRFSRAVTETYLRIETERAARMSQSDGASTSLPNLKPELDML